MEPITPLWTSDVLQPLWNRMPLEIPFRYTDETPQSPRRVTTTPFRTIFQTAVKTDPNTPAQPITDMFSTAVEAVRQTAADEEQLEYLMSTGQLDNPALLTIAAYKAGTAVDLLVQLRNRAVDAYNELMRISL